jgi:DNA primase
MAGRIPQSFVDDLLARVDIVELINEHVPLKRAGQDYQARCPFHDEKSPSFTVSPRKQFYHCFGCGAHGTALGFLMQHARMEFPEAVRALAERVGVPVPEEGSGSRPADAVVAPLYAALDRARQYFQRQLHEHPQAQRAREYLRARGLDTATVEAFQLGYAAPGWDGLIDALGVVAGAREELVRAGLAIPRGDGRPYDRFRDRVMYPILDRRGRTVGFGGRVLDDSKPKYLNSPETPVFHKGRELYGLYQAQRASREIELVVVVEGYMDVLALAQAGFTSAVATLGTAATAQHLEQLFRAAPRVVFCFDGDAAGRKAAWRALETSLPLLREGRQASFVFLPEGEDPDTWVRRVGAERFRAEVERGLPLSTFLFERLGARVDLATLDGRAWLVERARPLITRIPDGAFRQLIEKRLAELTRLEPTEVARALDPAGSTRSAARPAVARSPVRQPPSLVRRTVTLLLHHPEVLAGAGVLPPIRGAGLPGVEVLGDMIDLLRSRPELSMAGVLEHFRETETGRHLAKLAQAEDPSLPEADLVREFRDAVERIARKGPEQRFQDLAARARAGGLSEEETLEYAELCLRLGGQRGKSG